MGVHGGAADNAEVLARIGRAGVRRGACSQRDGGGGVRRGTGDPGAAIEMVATATGDPVGDAGARRGRPAIGRRAAFGAHRPGGARDGAVGPGAGVRRGADHRGGHARVEARVARRRAVPTAIPKYEVPSSNVTDHNGQCSGDSTIYFDRLILGMTRCNIIFDPSLEEIVARATRSSVWPCRRCRRAR